MALNTQAKQENPVRVYLQISIYWTMIMKKNLK